MKDKLRIIAGSAWFQNFITAVILLAGIVVGIQTYPGVVAEYGNILLILDSTILGIFVVEIIVKMGAEGSKPWRYFKDNWNKFDFLIVVACFLPIGSQYAMVLRLARLLRVLKLVKALPKLQLLVGALLKSIPSMGYVSLLLFMLFYMYAVTATFMFSANDPVHFDTLPLSMLSLFRAVTLEDWTDLMYIQMYGCNNYGYEGMIELCKKPISYPVAGAIFFVSFVLIGTMVILNLFIGVIMNSMDEARMASEEAGTKNTDITIDAELSDLNQQIKKLLEYTEKLQHRIKQKKM